MQFKNFIDKILSQPTKIKLLRFFVDSRPEMTGRELAKFCDVSHMQVYRILDALQSQGVVKKRQVAGAYLYTLNEKNVIVKNILIPLFQKEKNFLDEILKQLLNRITKKVLSIVVFGSVAEGRERPTSDVDIFILTKNKTAAISIRDILSEAETTFYEKTGNRLSPIILSVGELRKKSNTNKTLISKILSGRVIVGKSPKDFIYGK